MGGGDHCAVYGCDNDRRYPEKQIKLEHVGILRFYSPKNKKEIAGWKKSINRKGFEVKLTTKVCSNHFVAGYKSDACWKPTLYMKGYSTKEHKTRPLPKKRETKKRLIQNKATLVDGEPQPKKHVSSIDLLGFKDIVNNIEEKEEENEQLSDFNTISKLSDQACQTSDIHRWDKLKRNMFIEQATRLQNCYRYTGLCRDKLDLVFEFIKEKAGKLRYWKGSIDTVPTSKRRECRGTQRLLPVWDEFILTLVRCRKDLDVHFLADTFGISSGQVSRIFNTWVIFLSEELSFLVPFPDRVQIQRSMPKSFKMYPHLRIIIDCAEFFIQKPKLPSSQKITWSNYKHNNTVKLLIGITPNGIISFIPPTWTGMVSDKEIVRCSGLIDYLEEGDGVMADKGFIIRDLLAFKKINLITPAFCHGQRLSVRGTTHTRRVASLRSHVERYILKLKQFRILSGVIPLLLKPMLDRIIFLCAALSNLESKSIE